jgi:Holliday junction resolvase
VSTASKAKGTRAEREVVNYLQNWWPAAERRALSGNKDKGDVAGIPGLVVEVKAAVQQRLAEWEHETLIEAANADAKAFVLVVKRPHKHVSRWDAYMPASQAVGLGHSIALGKDFRWLRMDLLLAVAILHSHWVPSSPTTA